MFIDTLGAYRQRIEVASGLRAELDIVEATVLQSETDLDRLRCELTEQLGIGLEGEV